MYGYVDGNPSNEILIGRTIIGWIVNADKESILIHTTEGDIKGIVEGDCCSHSWIEHISGPDEAFKVVKVVEPELSDERSEGLDHWTKLGGYDNYLIKVYFTDLIAENGERLRLEYRNESNGYYGGWIIFSKLEEYETRM